MLYLLGKDADLWEGHAEAVLRLGGDAESFSKNRNRGGHRAGGLRRPSARLLLGPQWLRPVLP